MNGEFRDVVCRATPASRNYRYLTSKNRFRKVSELVSGEFIVGCVEDTPIRQLVIDEYNSRQNDTFEDDSPLRHRLSIVRVYDSNRADSHLLDFVVRERYLHMTLENGLVAQW